MVITKLDLGWNHLKSGEKLLSREGVEMIVAGIINLNELVPCIIVIVKVEIQPWNMTREPFSKKLICWPKVGKESCLCIFQSGNNGINEDILCVV